jgi:hypothetical protein
MLTYVKSNLRKMKAQMAQNVDFEKYLARRFTAGFVRQLAPNLEFILEKSGVGGFQTGRQINLKYQTFNQ